MQVGDAYEQRVAKQAALAYEERDRHRAVMESSISVQRQEQILLTSEKLLDQCITLTGAAC